MLAAATVCAQDDDKQNPIDFNREIKPLLSANCFTCHGPDAKTREADLRFDGPREGFAHVVGSIDDSELIGRITSRDAKTVMPPPESGLPNLKPEQIKTIRRWIAEGAAVSEHWAYRPIIRPKLPIVENDDWSSNPIDKYVLAKLKNQRLTTSEMASPSTLLRRICLDLVGLPPYAALDERARKKRLDRSQYHNLVEQLLGSPAFGERMAIDWLDLVRYADTSGIHSDNPISMSPFRDYVIESFNDSKPFDQFTREQLAGDLLANASKIQQIATAYNRLNMMTTEGGAQDKEYLAKYAADRVRTTSTVWLGSTLGCAECHDHKYDPFTSRDFYQFAAYFADITEKGYYPGAERTGDWGPKLEVPTKDQLAKEKLIQADLEKLRSALNQKTSLILKHQDQWEQQLAKSLQWKQLETKSTSSQFGTTLEQLPDQSILAKGKRPDTETYSISVTTPLKRIAAIRLEVMPHKSLPKMGPGRAGNGNFVLTEIRCEYRTGENSHWIEFGDAKATFDQSIAGDHTPYKVWNAASAIDKDKFGPKPGWAVLPNVGKPNFAIFKFATPLDTSQITRMIIHLDQKHDNPGHVLGRFRLSAIERLHDDWKLASAVPEDVAFALRQNKKNRSKKQLQLVRDYYVETHPELIRLNQEEQALTRKLEAQRKKRTTVLVTLARSPRTMRVLPRGNWLDESGEIVLPQPPSFLNKDQSQSDLRKSKKVGDRLDLADWILDKKNPLTARVQVNRLWRKFFGQGLVVTTDDFGSQGALPSHPELLDWLAAELIDCDWDLKHLIRLIVHSSTYQQSSMPRSSLDKVDISNRLLGRQNSFRLEAEIIRDQALAASGLLVRRIGGPSVKPYQPAGYYQHLNFPKRTYQADSGQKQYRRGMYTHWQRLFLHPMLQAFDAPSREECTAERVRSNTPQQALVLLNDPSFLEAATELADRLLQKRKNFESRVRWGYHLVLGREPQPNETKVLKNILDKRKLGGASERQCWIAVCRIMLNLHEFTTRY